MGVQFPFSFQPPCLDPRLYTLVSVVSCVLDLLQFSCFIVFGGIMCRFSTFPLFHFFNQLFVVLGRLSWTEHDFCCTPSKVDQYIQQAHYGPQTRVILQAHDFFKNHPDRHLRKSFFATWHRSRWDPHPVQRPSSLLHLLCSRSVLSHSAQKHRNNFYFSTTQVLVRGGC